MSQNTKLIRSPMVDANIREGTKQFSISNHSGSFMNISKKEARIEFEPRWLWARVHGNAACGNNDSSQINVSREDNSLIRVGMGLRLLCWPALGVACTNDARRGG